MAELEKEIEALKATLSEKAQGKRPVAIMINNIRASLPQYGIAKHKGYGTKQHMDALRTYGPSPIHRKQFIRFLDKDANK